MKNVLVFHSGTGKAWLEMEAGLRARAHEVADWHLQIIGHEPGNSPDIGRFLDFWKPIGCIVEGGSDVNGYYPAKAFVGMPTVFVSFSSHDLPKKALAVTLDSREVGKLAARVLMEKNLPNFAFVGLGDVFWSAERRQAFEESLKLHGLQAKVFEYPLHERACGLWCDSVLRKDLLAWVKSLPRPCGVFAALDQLSAELLSVCEEAEISVPADIAILGVDDDELCCENAVPTLSSIRANFAQGGRIAVDLLQEALSGRTVRSPRRIFMPERVVERQSTCVLRQDDRNVSLALEVIRKDACGGLQPKDVFSKLNCSRRYAELRFRQIVGHSVLEEIKAVRFARVKELLMNPRQKIGAIADQCGFSSEAYLRESFLKEEGESLSAWRKRHLS